MAAQYLNPQRAFILFRASLQSLRNREDKRVLFQLPFNFLFYYLNIHIFIDISQYPYVFSAQVSVPSQHIWEAFWQLSQLCHLYKTHPSSVRNAVGQLRCFPCIFSAIVDPHEFLPIFFLAAYVNYSSLPHSEEFFFPEQKERLWGRAKDFLDS